MPAAAAAPVAAAPPSAAVLPASEAAPAEARVKGRGKGKRPRHLTKAALAAHASAQPTPPAAASSDSSEASSRSGRRSAAAEARLGRERRRRKRDSEVLRLRGPLLGPTARNRESFEADASALAAATLKRFKDAADPRGDAELLLRCAAFQSAKSATLPKRAVQQAAAAAEDPLFTLLGLPPLPAIEGDAVEQADGVN